MKHTHIYNQPIAIPSRALFPAGGRVWRPVRGCVWQPYRVLRWERWIAAVVQREKLPVSSKQINIIIRKLRFLWWMNYGINDEIMHEGMCVFVFRSDGSGRGCSRSCSCSSSGECKYHTILKGRCFPLALWKFHQIIYYCRLPQYSCCSE